MQVVPLRAPLDTSDAKSPVPDIRTIRIRVRLPLTAAQAVVTTAINRGLEMRKFSTVAAALILICVGAWGMTIALSVDTSTPAAVVLPF